MTTITIDDLVFAELQRRAAETGETISRLVEEAVTRTTSPPDATSRPRRPFRLVTFGRGGGFSRYDVNKTSALLEIEDVERFGPAKPSCNSPTSTS